MSGTADDELWYVYAVTRRDRLPDGDDLRARVLTDGELAAVAAPVPAAEFSEEALAEPDLAWLERTAREHQRVVAALLPAGCVLPLPLATVCRDPAAVCGLLAANAARFAAALDRLDGRAEWGVTLYADASAPATPREPAARPAEPASGRDYLRRLKARRQNTDDATRQAQQTARDVHDALSAAAERARLHRPQDGRLTGEPGRNVLNAAYLVPRDRADAFTALVRRVAGDRPGVRLRLSGPWAPYSFTGDVTGELTGGVGGEVREEAGRR
jgi:hypothetical protein